MLQDVEILAGEGISSANHGYSASLNLVLTPTGYDNSVIAIRNNGDPPVDMPYGLRGILFIHIQ
jgi:hypothetical protein